jgi:hypothetical protein
LYIHAADGTRFDLSGKRGVYASSLAGFGMALSPVFADLGRGFFIPVSDDAEPQNQITCTITFTKTPYQTYQQFLDWIAAAGALTLVYAPTPDREFYRDITINFLQKGELNAVGWLEIPSSFLCTTPWYMPNPSTLTLESSGTDESMRYDFYYTDDLRYGEDSSSALSGIIQGSGHIPGSLDLIYHGAITNPSIRLTGNVSGKTYGICSVSAILTASDSLCFSTRYENAFVKRRSASGVETDLLDSLDLSTEPFFHIPVDEPCTLSIESDSPFSGKAELLIFYYYRSV